MTDRPEPDLIPPGAPGGEDARRIREPGWISRNRAALMTARRLGASVVMFAPLPARAPLALACVAIDGAMLYEDGRRGGRRRGELVREGASLVLEAGILAGSLARAPHLLARSVPHLVAARRLLGGLESGRG